MLNSSCLLFDGYRMPFELIDQQQQQVHTPKLVFLQSSPKIINVESSRVRDKNAYVTSACKSLLTHLAGKRFNVAVYR